MSSAGRLSGYDWIGENLRSEGGTYAGQSYYAYKPRILLHMTVSSGMSRSYIAGHPYPPHLWANPYTGAKYQTVELDRSAFALYQPNYGYHWTNKADYCLQTELIGIPIVNQTTYTDAHLRWIAEHVVVPQERWLRARGLTANIGNVSYYTNSSGGASVDWPGRFTEQQWADFNGLCQHLSTWGNDHWDCSVERLDLISKYALEILGGAAPPTEEEDLTPEQAKQLANVDSLLKSLTPTIQQTFNQTFWAWGTLQPGKGDLDTLARNIYNTGEATAKKVNSLTTTQTSTPVPVVDVEAALAKASVQQLSAALNKKLSGQ
jgi:hypothetical protein